MNRNDLMTFAPSGRDRETLPCIHLSALGRSIECADQIGVMRLLKGDRIRVEEIRDHYVLAAHTALKGGLLLIAADQLHPIPSPASQPEEDIHL